MKLSSITLFLFILISSANAQEWRMYSGPDYIKAFELANGYVWAVSPSGLTRIDVNTGEKTNWNMINLGLRTIQYDRIAIDVNGGIWMGSELGNHIMHFDGTNWQIFEEINGKPITGIDDIQASPDGKVWILADLDKPSLISYESGMFTIIPVPANNSIEKDQQKSIGVDINSHVWIVFNKFNIVIGEYDGTGWFIHDLKSLGVYFRNNSQFIGDHLGNMYVLTRSGSGPDFIKYDGSIWNLDTIPADVNIYFQQNHSLSVDPQNRIFVCLRNGTYLIHDDQGWTTVNLPDIGLSNGYADGILTDQNSKQWIFFHHGIPNVTQPALYTHDGSGTNKIDLSNSPLPANKLGHIMVDPQNNKWILSDDDFTRFDGNKWDVIPDHDYTLKSFAGPNPNGGVWFNPAQSALPYFDGVSLSDVLLTDPKGQLYTHLTKAISDRNGKVYVATGEDHILVLDQGRISYLDSLYYVLNNHAQPSDELYYVALDTSGRFYTWGWEGHRLENDGTWKRYPYWGGNVSHVQGIKVSPEGDLWIADGISTYQYGPNYYYYHEDTTGQLGLFSFLSPYKKMSMPAWDSKGNKWFATESGLCKEHNGTWVCYNETNSPIPSETTLDFINYSLEDFVIDKFDNIWILTQYGGLLVFNENHINNIEGQKLPVISGTIYRDLNQDGVYDTGDIPIPQQLAILIPDSIVSFADQHGRYHFSVIPNEYKVTYQPKPNWHIDQSQASYEIGVGSNDVQGLDFAVAPDAETSDVRLFINEGRPQCYKTVPYWLSYDNFGTMAESGEIIFVKDPETEVEVVSPQPSAIIDDTIKWTYSNLLPFNTEKIRLNITLPGPDTTVLFQGILKRFVNSVLIPADTINLSQGITCSHDPNDKIAKTSRSVAVGKSYLSDPIQYTIRFQNTGNDTAYNVIIRDLIDDDLDLSTFEIIGGSHPFETLLKGRMLEFRFINILLPDDKTNEDLSNGFVSYSIKAKQDLALPAVVENNADIFFDFNNDVRTNTTVNKLVEFITATDGEVKIKPSISAYPNPATDEIVLEMKDNSILAMPFRLMDSRGKYILSGVIKSGEPNRLGIGQLPAGLYFIEAGNGTERCTLLFVKN